MNRPAPVAIARLAVAGPMTKLRRPRHEPTTKSSLRRNRPREGVTEAPVPALHRTRAAQQPANVATGDHPVLETGQPSQRLVPILEHAGNVSPEPIEHAFDPGSQRRHVAKRERRRKQTHELPLLGARVTSHHAHRVHAQPACRVAVASDALQC